MKTFRILSSFVAVALALGGISQLRAQTATNGVTADVPVINLVTVTGAATFTMPSPVAGQIYGATGITNSVPVFRLTTNQTNQRVTAVLSTALPTGASLTVQLATNSSGLSTTPLSLSATAGNLLTAISNLATDAHDAAGIGLTYTLTLSENTPSGTISPTVTYTITAGT